MKFNRWIICSIFIVFSINIIAQPFVELKKYQDKYPGEHIVVLKNNAELDISTTKEGDLEIIRTITEERMLLKQKSASLYNSDKISFSHFFELQEINAYTLVPGEKKYSTAKVTEFTTKDVLSNSVFYDDVKSKSFFFPSISEGAITHLDYKTKITEPRFINGFYFGGFAPMEENIYTIIADNNIELIFKYFNTTAEELNFSKEVGKKRTTYKWFVSNPKKFKHEDNAPSPQSFIPHVIPRIKSYTYKDEEIKILESLDDLHQWYFKLISDVNTEPSEELKTLVDSITNGIEKEEDKVKAIYYWVQDNIKYIAMEAGLGGFIPEEATEVCNNKYGDCKGMSSITNEMLKLAGINSHLTWIGSRSIVYDYNDIPTPVVDNHMICTYIDNNGKYHFLDATGSEVPFDLSTGFIQGKEALINLGNGEYEVKRVPVVDRLTNLETDTTIFTITPQGKVVGKSTYTSKGINSIYLRRKLKGRTNDELKKYVSGYNSKGNNKFFVDTFTVENISNKDLPINISLEFHIEDYITINGDELYVNMNLDRFYEDGKIDDTRENAFEIDYKSTIKNITYLDVPEGYTIEYIPNNDQFKNDLFGFNITYTKVNETRLKYEFELYEDYLIIEPKHFNSWNNMIKKLKNNYSETVILKKK